MNSFRSSKVQTLEGFPIRNSTDQGILAPPRGLSQLYTSFIGCQYQGIHRKLFVALPEQLPKAPVEFCEQNSYVAYQQLRICLAQRKSNSFTLALLYTLVLTHLTYLN